MLEERLALPFETTMQGVVVNVATLDFHGDNNIIALCTRARQRQAIPSLDLPTARAGWGRVDRGIPGSEVDERSYAPIVYYALPSRLLATAEPGGMWVMREARRILKIVPTLIYTCYIE